MTSGAEQRNKQTNYPKWVIARETRRNGDIHMKTVSSLDISLVEFRRTRKLFSDLVLLSKMCDDWDKIKEELNDIGPFDLKQAIEKPEFLRRCFSTLLVTTDNQKRRRLENGLKRLASSRCFKFQHLICWFRAGDHLCSFGHHSERFWLEYQVIRS